MTSLFLTIAFAALSNAAWLAFGRTVHVATARIVKAAKGRKPVCQFVS